jgi:von Willebrand factor A domain-containing protein 7
MAEIRRPSGVVQEQRAICVVVRLCLFLTFPAALPGAQEANRSRRFGPDSCGPVDPAYIRIADETGGLPMFLQPSEAGKATHFMRESSGENHVTLFWATAKFQGGRQEFTVPVDSSVERVTFSLSTDTKGTLMTILRPSGEVVASGAAVEITELNCGRVVTVATPEAGDWRAQVAGSGGFWLEAGGKSEISLVSVEFVRLGGRPGHEGYFRIPGQPIAGQAATLRVTLSGPAKSVDFQLVSEDGEVIQPLPLRRESSGDESEGDDRLDAEYYGSFDLPSQAFRVAVTGQDEKGHAYPKVLSHPVSRGERGGVASARP